jgi:dTDP-4-dehydrorhamnose reductase
VFEHPFCHEDEESFAMRVLASLRDGRPVLAADDLAATPTYRPASVDAALDLLLDGASGVWRVKGADTLSWAEFGRRVARVTGFDPDLVRPASAESLGLADEAFAPAAFDERYDLPPLDRLLERFRDDEREGRPQVLMYAAE